MTPDLDIYRSANVLVRRHGEDAPIHAAIRADAMLEAGDLDGYGGVAEDTAGGGGVAGDGAWSWGEGSLRPALVFEGFYHGRDI